MGRHVVEGGRYAASPANAALLRSCRSCIAWRT